MTRDCSTPTPRSGSVTTSSPTTSSSIKVGYDPFSRGTNEPVYAAEFETVTAVFVLRPLLGDRGRITKQSPVCFPLSIRRLEQNAFSWRRKDRSSFRSVSSLFHARGAATEKALSPIRRRVHGTTRSPMSKVRHVFWRAKLEFFSSTLTMLE